MLINLAGISYDVPHWVQHMWRDGNPSDQPKAKSEI